MQAGSQGKKKKPFSTASVVEWWPIKVLYIPFLGEFLTRAMGCIRANDPSFAVKVRMINPSGITHWRSYKGLGA